MTMTKLFFKVCGLFLVAVLIFTACNNEDNKGTKKAFFRYNQASGISSLDPAFAKDQANIWAANQLFNGLVYTFFLRNDVSFHDNDLFHNGKGPLVTAHDVAYSLNRIVDKKVASAGAWLFNDRIADNNAFVAKNDSVFQMTLKKPFRPMLGILSMQYCSVVPEKIVAHYGKAFRKNPVGTGPFKLKVWKENEVMVLEKNPTYFEKTAQNEQMPFIDGVKITFIENKRNAFLKFIDGELDMLSGIDATYKDDLLSQDGDLLPNRKETINLLRSPYMNTEYLGFQTNPEKQKNKALLIKEVRQAINYGFNRTKMIQFLRNNIGNPAISGFVPKGFPSFDANKVKGYDYNLAKARELLAQAGYPNGEGLPEITLETTSSYKDLCTYIQKELGELGLKVKMEMHPPAFLREKIAKGESDFFRASWIGDYPDAETYLTVLYGGNPAPPNYTQFKNTNYDALYEKALATTNDAELFDLYQQMDRIIIEEAPIVPLFYDEVLRFVQKEVKGLGVNTFNLLTLKKVQLDKK